MAKDTCAMVAVTLPMATPASSAAMPIIWSVDHVPYDSYKLIAVAEPLGGAIVFATNHLLYYNQNIFYGLGLNEYCGHMSDIPLDDLGKSGNYRVIYTI